MGLAEQLRQNIIYVAHQLGFGDCRIAAVQKPPNLARYQEWLSQGMYGDMTWFERNNERRSDPTLILDGAKSIVSLAMNYNPGETHPNQQYRIAKYSWNNDYHDLIESKLKDLDIAMQEMGGTQRYYVYTGPVLERDFATVSGLGWNGKSTVQIHRQLGTWFFLAEVITTLDVEHDEPIRFYYRKLPNNEKGSIYFAHEPLNEKDIYFEMVGSRSSSAKNPEDGVLLGEKFSYEIDVKGNLMTVKLFRPGKETITQEVDMSESGYDQGDDYMYFKAGAYLQDSTGEPDDFAEVVYYELNNTH